MAPAVAAARMRRIPYVLHEKDVRPGLATRYFAAGAAAVCTTLPGTELRLPKVRTVLTGVPLREGFEPRTPEVPPRRLLITGGSQGARHLNEATWAALDDLCARFEEVVHVAGEQGAQGVREHARERYRGLTFADDMAALMGRADLVVSRAGVGTIAEATAVGLPMLLVPGTFGGGHQEENAAAMVVAGAAVRIADQELSGETLVAAIDKPRPRPAESDGRRVVVERPSRRRAARFGRVQGTWPDEGPPDGRGRGRRFRSGTCLPRPRRRGQRLRHQGIGDDGRARGGRGRDERRPRSRARPRQGPARLQRRDQEFGRAGRGPARWGSRCSAARRCSRA